MIFNSVEFLIFLPVVFLLFWVCPHKLRWVVLLIASYFFYMYWNWKLVFLIVFTTCVSYAAGLGLERWQDKPAAKKAVLISAMLLCLGVLIFFKYFNFFYEIFNDLIALLGGKGPGGYFIIMLPVGISFYTFQTASYVVDVYKGSIPAERHLGYYMLFVSYFPQLVAGPIERPGDLLPQLKREAHIREVDFSNAFRFMLVGFFKKIAVADILGIFVNGVYNNLSAANGTAVLIATVLFAVQILCDFSGYTDIAIGCACLFGVKLTENFRAPYLSKSIKEFWGRWHISLSSWLRDYIYFPLGGSRVRKARWAFNIFVVFFVSGLWHGASYNFVVWGLLHALFQVVGTLTLNARNQLWKKCKVDPEGRLVGSLRVVGTFALVTLAWIFFRANTFSDALTVFEKLFTQLSFGGEGWASAASAMQLTKELGIFALVALVLLFGVERLKYLPLCLENNPKSVYRYALLRTVVYILLAWCVVIAWIYLQSSDVGSSFIYFQF